VLYRQTPEQIWSLVRGLRAAARLALRRDAFRSVLIAFGDSSPRRTIDTSMEQHITTSLREHGVQAFHYVFYDENQGSARGQNTLFGLREVDTDYVFVMNPDVYLCPDVLCELLRPFIHVDVGIVEARQLPLEHPKSSDPVSGSTSWASGACMMIRADVMQAIGGFDGDSFFLYCDDVDLSWRARLAGYDIIHQPTARVFHDKRLHSDGRLATSESERYYAAEAALLMAWKYSRPDLVTSWSTDLSSSSDPIHQKAVQAFRERESKGELPKSIDPEHRVAEFDGYNYGHHRFDVRV
jgi:GT2 family glycosyltransferase